METAGISVHSTTAWDAIDGGRGLKPASEIRMRLFGTAEAVPFQNTGVCEVRAKALTYQP